MSTTPLVVVHPDKQSVADGGAARLVTTLLDLQAAGRAPHISLTGGSLGSAIITSILQVPAHTAVDWSTVSVWWGDERYLPAGDADRNDTQNDAAGLDRLGLDPANVHRVAGPDSSDSAEDSAEQYSAAIRGSGGGEFDVMILGVGPDGHVASLFPGHPAQQTTDAIAVAVHDSPKPPPDRVSLTFECLTRSDRVWFLVAGADKAEAVRNGVAGAGPELSSAAQVHGIHETIWLVDADSAAQLPA
jgi:6-phosphogluconolactonase